MACTRVVRLPHVSPRGPCSGSAPFLNLKLLHSFSDSPQICITFSIAMMVSLLAFRLRNPLAPSSVADFSGMKEHCAHVRPIPTKSFIKRQDLLAKTLQSLGASAYIAEPGANAGFYANLSGSHWHLSERPLLLIVTPTVDEEGAIRGNISILTPMFEATRARLLPIPSDSEITFPEWPEDVDPYQVALSAISDLDDGTIFVDGSTRQFVVDGLQKAAGGGSKVVSAPVEIRRLRERKSKEELNILKCANEVSVVSPGLLHLPCSWCLIGDRSPFLLYEKLADECILA